MATQVQIETLQLFAAPAMCQVKQLKEAEISGYAVKRLLAVTCDAIVRLTDDAWRAERTPWPFPGPWISHFWE